MNNIQKIDKEHAWFTIGKIGFFFLEIRGHRSWHRVADYDEKSS